MTDDVSRALADVLREREPKQDPPWVRIATIFASILVCVVVLIAQLSATAARDALQDALDEKSRTIALQEETIAQQKATLEDAQRTLASFTQEDACLVAFDRLIAASQRAYITGGLGGLVAALAIEDLNTRRPAVATALAEHDRLRQEALDTLAERDAYQATDPHPPCPITTTN